MPLKIAPVPNAPNQRRITLDELTGGWSTRTFPHLLPINRLQVATNVCFLRDGLVSKRPGNVTYGSAGGGSGGTGSGLPIQSLGRYYRSVPPSNQKVGVLVAASGGQLYHGNDTTGAFNPIANGSVSATSVPTYAQMYDPDNTNGGRVSLFVCDGVNIPHVLDRTFSYVPVQTGSPFLPNGVRSGSPITPAYCLSWNHKLVYAGEPTDPGALYISDALRPERFTGYSLVTSDNVNYIPYYPGGQDGTLGNITGLAAFGNTLVIFFTAGIVSCYDTGSYGAYQFIFTVVSSSTGCPSPASIVAFDSFAAFFGGDRFYATDGQTVQPLPDELPTVYNSTLQPPMITNITGVVSVRQQTRYWAAFDAQGLGYNNALLVFDTAANGGWTYGTPEPQDVPDQQSTGGAWALYLGMNVGAAVECRREGDDFQLYWGSANADLVAQHGPGTNIASDFGAPIACEIRAKALFLDEPVNVKSVLSMYPLLVYQANGAAYSSIVTPYIIGGLTMLNCVPITIQVPALGTTYGSAPYGTFLYDSPYGPANFSGPKAEPLPQPFPTQLFAPGILESSANPFNLIGFVMEVQTDEPQP